VNAARSLITEVKERGMLSCVVDGLWSVERRGGVMPPAVAKVSSFIIVASRLSGRGSSRGEGFERGCVALFGGQLAQLARRSRIAKHARTVCPHRDVLCV